jgi:RNA polymerase sigma-70 factor (ECF subfamily)
MTNRAGSDRWGDLMRAGMSGDEMAYRLLLDELSSALRKTVRGAMARSGAGNADVEDIVQETLIAVHLKRHTWNSTFPLSPWLNAIARHKMIDALRRRSGHRTVPLDAIDELAAPAAVEDTNLRDAERMFKALDQRQERLVRAISIEGRSAAEVGRELGMTEGAVRVALHRTLRRLARAYGKATR